MRGKSVSQTIGHGWETMGKPPCRPLPSAIARRCRGDGEVCVTALEMCLTGTFTFVLHKANGVPFKMPRAETPTHFISMGMNEDLDQAMKQALREMIAFICSRSNLSREQAYAFCSLAVDFHVTQTVNGEKGVHGMLKKGLLF